MEWFLWTENRLKLCICSVLPCSDRPLISQVLWGRYCHLKMPATQAGFNTACYLKTNEQYNEINFKRWKSSALPKNYLHNCKYLRCFSFNVWILFSLCFHITFHFHHVYSIVYLFHGDQSDIFFSLSKCIIYACIFNILLMQYNYPPAW